MASPISCSSAARARSAAASRRSLPSRWSRSKPTKTSRPGCQRIADRSVEKSDRPASFMTMTSPSMIADFTGSVGRRLDDRADICRSSRSRGA